MEEDSGMKYGVPDWLRYNTMEYGKLPQADYTRIVLHDTTPAELEEIAKRVLAEWLTDFDSKGEGLQAKCRICGKTLVDTVSFPCWHMCMCEPCAQAHLTTRPCKCLECGNGIRRIKKVV
jgi:hypothetical protein